MYITPQGADASFPMMLSSPMSFSIVAPESSAGLLPNIILILTRDTFEGLTGEVKVQWSAGSLSLQKISFEAASSGYVPPSTVTSFDSGRYKFSEVKQYFGIPEFEEATFFFVRRPFLSGAVGRVGQNFSVSVPSPNPKVMVLAVARTECSTTFNMRVQPCTTPSPVPEFSSLLAMIVPLLVLSVCLACRRLFAIRHRSNPC